MSNQIVLQKQCGICGELKDVSMFSKNAMGKYQVSSRCRQCDKQYYEKNKDTIKQKAKEWRLFNRGQSLQVKKQHYLTNKEKYKTNARKWEKDNKEKHKQLGYFYCAKRRASKKTATPPWADLDKIKQIYTMAFEMKSNGLDVEVDHIIPLIHNDVCGLHVHQNLRIISKSENRKKHNQFLIEEI